MKTHTELSVTHRDRESQDYMKTELTSPEPQPECVRIG